MKVRVLRAINICHMFSRKPSGKAGNESLKLIGVPEYKGNGNNICPYNLTAKEMNPPARLIFLQGTIKKKHLEKSES